MTATETAGVLAARAVRNATRRRTLFSPRVTRGYILISLH
jgi:hypothetical protein